MSRVMKSVVFGRDGRQITTLQIPGYRKILNPPRAQIRPLPDMGMKRLVLGF